MSSKPVVLLLGATGFTGKLIARYLANHKERDAFSLVLGARSKPRLDELAKDIGLNDSVKLQVVDVTDPKQVDAAVRIKGVVINTVGPFFTWGTPVVEACVRHGTHYVDLTGEAHWIMQIVKNSHFPATKTGALIVPSCGFDSVPADILSYASAKALRDFAGTHVDIDTSTSAYAIRGGISGGTFSTAITAIEQVPPTLRSQSRKPFALSPSVGQKQPPPSLVYSLFVPDTKRTLRGGFFFMSPANRALQQRSWGLFEVEAAKDENQLHFGKHMKYNEFLVTGGRISGLLFSIAELLFFGAFVISPLRWLIKKLLPAAGQGPSESAMKNGKMTVTNVTTAVANGSGPPLQAKSVIKGKGDPGYWLTTYMISEAALSIALRFDDLPAMGKRGGVLTPATALGDVFVERMNATGVLSVESSVIAVTA